METNKLQEWERGCEGTYYEYFKNLHEKKEALKNAIYQEVEKGIKLFMRFLWLRG